MEKEFNFDQEVIMVNISEEEFPEPVIGELSDSDYTVVDESDIDWSNL